MGYTHYWKTNNYGAQEKAGFEKALPIVRKILKKYDNIIQKEYDDEKKPVVSKKQIRFNGKGDDGHETFLFVNSDKQGDFYNPSFAFCKTARKPYDVAVCEVLLVLNAFCPALSISSDGFSGYLEDPEIDGTWADAVKNVKQYGIEYEVKVVNEREPYCDIEPILKGILVEIA